MSHELDPKVGRWYQRLDDEQLFKVVSIDEDDGLIEIRAANGELEEIDSTEWIELDLELADAPEDYRDPDDAADDDDEPEAEDSKATEGEPSRGRAGRVSRDGWDDDDDDDDDDWDDDDDDDDDDDSDR